jgi:hypothetical protein
MRTMLGILVATLMLPVATTAAPLFAATAIEYGLIVA